MLAFDLCTFDKLRSSLVVLKYLLEHPAWRCNAYEYPLIVTSFSFVLKYQIRNRRETYHSAAYVL